MIVLSDSRVTAESHRMQSIPVGKRNQTSSPLIPSLPDCCCDNPCGSNSIYTVFPKHCPLMRLDSFFRSVAHSDDQTQYAVYECGLDRYQSERQSKETLCSTVIASIPSWGSNDWRLDTFARIAFIARAHMSFLYDVGISLPSCHATCNPLFYLLHVRSLQ